MLFEFDGPVGVIEEGLPAGVFILAEADGDDGVTVGLFWFLDEVHASLFGRTTTFAAVAWNTAADEVFPTVAATESTGDDVVECEFAGDELLAAVLAHVAIACVDVASVEFDVLFGQAVVSEEADDARDSDVHADGFDPVGGG